MPTSRILVCCTDGVIYLTLRRIPACETASILEIQARISLTFATKGRGQHAQQQNNGVCRTHCPLIHGMQAVGAPGTHTVFVRVGFCPMLTTRRVLLSFLHEPITMRTIFCSHSSPKMANAIAQPPLAALTLATNLTMARYLEQARHSKTPRGQRSVAANC